jgi:2-amino-4-hydroxy-6-hydroxymethyldihydropteridine diphosphokinase
VTVAYLGLGSNLGDRAANLRRALRLLGGREGIRVVRASTVHETDPVGPAQPDYLNAVAEVDTSLPARQLLEAALAVEAEMGRIRAERWGPRVIDIDLLMYDDERIDEPDLLVPHPHMWERPFVLVPLAELAPDAVLADGRSMEEAAGDRTGVRPFPDASLEDAAGGAPTVAVVGAGRVATTLAVLLRRAGYRILAASGRDASARRVAAHLPGTAFHDQASAADAARAADVVIVGIPDDLIEPTVAALASAGAFHDGQHVLHVSGSTSLDALSPASDAGGRVLSLHPLQSFPDVDTGLDRLPGSGMAVTATTEVDVTWGERLVADVGAVPFRLADADKALYHAGAVFAANYLVTVEALAERLMRASGVADPAPLLQALACTSFDRTFALGPGAALTGPAVRGDVGTIERNISALRERAPDAVAAYVELGRAAARLAADSGRLSADDLARVLGALER